MAQTASATGTFTTSFTASGHLVLELGRRLVGRPSVAIAELVKNAYDADASYCRMEHEDDILLIADDGHGMTRQEFLDTWMVIATDSKRKRRTSKKYKRPLSGAKGLGRFSTQFLGHQLDLVTYAKNRDGSWTRLSCSFPWDKFGEGADLTKQKLKYKVETVEEPPAEDRTILKISKLAFELDFKLYKEVNKTVSEITTPLQELDHDGLLDPSVDQDPGFRFLRDIEDEDDITPDLAKEILDRATARAQIKVKNNQAQIRVTFRGSKVRRQQTIRLEKDLVGRMAADIRFIPKRAGTFSGLSIDGRRAYTWAREQSGVKIYDHGFQVRPYGVRQEDDWLGLAVAKAGNMRKWLSDFTVRDQVSVVDDEFSKQELDPYLKRPNNDQLVGAVFVRSQDLLKKEETGAPILRQASSREGYLDNEGFRMLRSVVQAAIELMAKGYTEVLLEEKRAKLARKREGILSSLTKAADAVSQNPRLSAGQKGEVLKSITRLQTEYEDYDKRVRENQRYLEAISQLGMLAGFMSHEMDEMLNSVEEMLDVAKANENSIKKLGGELFLRALERAHRTVSGQQQFVRLFVDLARKRDQDERISTHASLDIINDSFHSFCKERGITVEYRHIPVELESPPLPPAAYMGALVNVFSNAVKAVVDVKNTNEEARVRFEAFDDEKAHVVEIYDTGYGLDDDVKPLIFDPIFSTTDQNNALGKGMGLGLHLVKRLMQDYKGKISVIDPPEGFSTGFRLRWAFD